MYSFQAKFNPDIHILIFSRSLVIAVSLLKCHDIVGSWPSRGRPIFWHYISNSYLSLRLQKIYDQLCFVSKIWNSSNGNLSSVVFVFELSYRNVVKRLVLHNCDYQLPLPNIYYRCHRSEAKKWKRPQHLNTTFNGGAEIEWFHITSPTFGEVYRTLFIIDAISFIFEIHWAVFILHSHAITKLQWTKKKP